MKQIKWTNELLLDMGFFLAAVCIIGLIGCSKTDTSSASMNDSTRTFRQIVTSPERLSGLNKTELAGRSVFMRYCQVCHGAEGDGKGFNAFNLQNSFAIQPANLTDSIIVAGLTEEAIITAISKGGKAVGRSQYMPPWGNTLSSQEIENAATFIKRLSMSRK